MDANNPAVVRQTTITPADLEAVAKDPSLMSAMARKYLLVQMDYLHNMGRSANFPTKDRLVFSEQLAKIGGVIVKNEAAAGPAAPAFSVNINFPEGFVPPQRGKSKPVTIEADTGEVVEEKEHTAVTVTAVTTAQPQTLDDAIARLVDEIDIGLDAGTGD